MDAVIPGRSAAYRTSTSRSSIISYRPAARIKMETHKLGLNIELHQDADDAIKRVAEGSVEVVFL